jgi:uncharacterized repeat protein (TIGR03803 family)
MLRISTRFALTLATLLFGLLFVTPAALAQGQDCPPEPASNTPIDDGEVFAGPNCTLQSPGDVDSFIFAAYSGQTFHMAVAINGSAPTNICLTLYDPNAVQIFSGCSSVGYPRYQNSVVNDQVLTVTGTYTIAITETGSGTLNYGVALERLYPFPPNAQEVNLGVQVDGDIIPLTDSNAFTFPSATTGTARASATLPGSANQNLCMTVFLPDGTQVQTKCTSIGYPNYVYTIQIDFTPTEDGTSMAFLQVAGNDGTASYTFEASCLIGTCNLPTQSFTSLYNFDWGDGANPKAALAQGADGNLYGTTADGGIHSGGTVFKITTGGALTTVYSFCLQTGCSDGNSPEAGLVLGSDGSFYGTTAKGGANNVGTVFKITPSGVLTTLHSFNSTDGADPEGALLPFSDGNFYGTTYGGGNRDRGTVFKITPSGTLTSLHSFNLPDGLNPEAGLVLGADGNFYGTTYWGGANERGTVFKITPSGTLTTLYSFNFTDGVNPEAGLVLGADGNFYGTTYGGGAHAWGTVFKITPGGALTTLYSFGHSDGANPEAGLVQASDGNFYGTTYGGGADIRGTIFEITPSGLLTTVYSFSYPEAGLIQANDGNLYGTTYEGGAHNFGTVFKLALGQ